MLTGYSIGCEGIHDDGQTVSEMGALLPEKPTTGMPLPGAKGQSEK